MVSDTPVIFIVFNRPRTTSLVFEQIRAAKPKQLTIISDGPRKDHPNDRELVAETRNLVETGIDWECDLNQIYSDHNLGCGVRIATGLTAAFVRYDRAIVLEDDTLPNPSFFDFCEQMLNRYANDESVVHISGSNIPVGLKKLPPQDNYCVNLLPDIWGWATWRRAWKNFDFGIQEWEEVRHSEWLSTLISSEEELELFKGLFEKQFVLKENHLTWDWSWIYACMRNGNSITPLTNLVTNLGFDAGATNTTSPIDELSKLPSAPINVDNLPSAEEALQNHQLAEQLDQLLLAKRFGGDKLRRHKTLLGRLRSGRLLRKAKYLLNYFGQDS